MKLTPALVTLTTLALLASTAQAQVVVGYPTLGSGEAVISGPTALSTANSIELDVGLTVPLRYGLHLHRSTWTINLADLDADNTYSDGQSNTEDGGLVCWRAGQHDPATGRDVVYPIQAILNNPASNWVGDSGPDDLANPYDYAAQLPDFRENLALYPYGGVNGAGNVLFPIPRLVPNIVRADSYPGFVVSGGALQWKGPIMCTFQTIVQKFANVPATVLDLINFTAELNLGAGATAASWPTTIVADRFTDPDPALNTSSTTLTLAPPTIIPPSLNVASSALLASTLAPNGAASTIATFTSRTRGWLDDNVLVALVFDGREVGSSTVQNAQLQFNLFNP